MDCTNFHLSSFADTLVTGGQEFWKNSLSRREHPEKIQITTLKSREIVSIKKNNVVSIETLGNRGDPKWNYFHFENGGEIEGPVRIFIEGEQTRSEIKWKDFPAQCLKNLKATLIVVSIATLALLLLVALYDVFLDIDPHVYSVVPHLFVVGFIFLMSLVTLGSVGDRSGCFIGKIGYKDKIKSRFCTNSSTSVL
jgi:hypothetical protein